MENLLYKRIYDYYIFKNKYENSFRYKNLKYLKFFAINNENFDLDFEFEEKQKKIFYNMQQAKEIKNDLNKYNYWYNKLYFVEKEAKKR